MLGGGENRGARADPPAGGPRVEEAGGDQLGGPGEPGCTRLSGREDGERSLGAPAAGG